MSDDDAYRPDDAAANESPFAGSDNHELGDLKLQPLTAERFVAAQSIGLTWPIHPDSYRNDGGLYKGEVIDCVIVLWLCQLPIDSDERGVWTVKSAMRKPEQALAAALQWGSERGLTLPQGKPFWDAINTFEDILEQVSGAYTTPKAAPRPKD